MSYLFAAYAATWIIHVSYLGWLARQYAQLRREIDQFKKR